MKHDQKGPVTRRNFLGHSARVVAGAGLLATSYSASAHVDARDSDSASLPGKIALEEHFVIPETLGASYGAPGSPDFQR